MNKNLEKFLIWTLSLFFGFVAIFKLLWAVIQNGVNIFRVTQRSPPPKLMDKRWGNHHYVNLKKQGIKLHYVEKGNRTSPLMVCLHGFPECWLSWRYQLEEFSSNYRVVAVDMRGYGDSDKPQGVDAYDVNTIVEDIREFISVVNDGKGKCVLAAHDWGGVIAWMLVEKYPELFTRHISLNGPNLRVFKEHIFTSPKQFKMSWYIFFFQLRWLPEIVLRMKDLEPYADIVMENREDTDDISELYKYYYSQKGAFTPPLNYYRKVFDLELKEYGKIKVPTVVIWGEKDKALTKEVGRRSVSLCESCEFKLVEKGGHFLHVHESQEVNRLIWDFLKQ